MSNDNYSKMKEDFFIKTYGHVWAANITYRELLWLVQYLCNAENADIIYPEVSDDIKRLKEQAFGFMMRNNLNVNSIQNECIQSLVPDDKYYWINRTNLRQLLFLFHIENSSVLRKKSLKAIVDYNPQLELEKFYTSIIFNISVSTQQFNDEHEHIERLKRRYEDGVAPEKYIEWLGKDDEEQLLWLKNHLVTIKGFDNLDKFENKDLYHILILCIDILYWDRHSTVAFQAEFGRMTKSWSQQKHRLSGRESTKYHIPLTKKGRERLLKLAEFHNEKEHILLERLINQEYEQEMTDENGKDKY